MRKTFSKAVVLAAMAAIFLTATAAAAETGTVTGSSLRIRQEPSTQSEALAQLNAGTQVQILNDLGDWYQISWGSYSGYVSADYISRSSTSTSTPAAPAPFAQAAIGQLGAVTGTGVNFRSAPSTDASVYYILSQGSQMTITGVSDGWCKMDDGSQEGYVNADYVSVNGIPLVDPKGIITGDCVNIRSIPSTDGDIVSKVYGGALVDLLSLENGWYAVSYGGAVGYIRNDCLSVYTGSSASGVGAAIAETALQYLGTPYAYGGASSRGFDCSGFTMYVLSQHGYSAPHSATSQWNSSGTYVERSDLQPGDLVLFCDPSRSNGKACSHVGIYIGDNEFVHASSGSSGKYVRISSLSEDYYNGYYVGAKRVA